MSTRSGKRIHSSFQENTLKPELEPVPQSERKTRSRRYKENVEELSVSVIKTKKRSNYVSYPTEDDVAADTVDNKEEDTKPARLLRKNALKERILVANTTDSADPPTGGLKPSKATRKTRKFVEDTEDARDNHAEEVTRATTSKKQKKKKKSIPDETVEVVSKKKSKKKVKKAKRSNSMVVEDIVPESREIETLNRSNMSVDSYHSAAGSPIKHTKGNGTSDIISPPEDFKPALASKSASDTAHKVEGRQTRSVARLSRVNIPQSTLDSVLKVTRKRKSSFKDLDKMCNETDNVVLEEFDTMLTNVSKKRKSNIVDPVLENNTNTNFDEEIKNSTIDLEDLERRKSVIKGVINSIYDKSECPKSSETDTMLTVEDKLDKNTTYERELTPISKTPTPQSKLNSTFEKSNFNSPIELVSEKEKPAINTTFEKDNPIIDSTTRKSAIINTTYEKDSITDTNQDLEVRSIINDTYDKNEASDILSETEDSNTNLRISTQKQSTVLNSTYDKTEKHDSTYDKDKNPDSTFDKDKKLDMTFDKNSKSSLISSDYSNITLDKSEYRISITSDDSKENIINTTPVLIESSLDESQLNTSKQTHSETNSKISPIPAPVTPLKREGTFTKDGSDIIETQVNLPITPTRKMSLPSPGCTPFPHKSVSKDKSMLNITRSLEKSRRSSLAEPLPRATRVMFCSPVNDPMVVAQQRRKVIKSNLKGSNKSFVFEDAGPAARAAPRKRSFTHSDVEEAQTKRNRFMEGAPTSLGRVLRARSTSATVILTVPGTPSKKTITTPRKSETKISRTKLPNFAALHQREFSKMESLDECQERKARRAKQLLTPTGAVTVLERSSPRDNPTEAKKPDEEKKSPNLTEDKEQNERRQKDSKKPDTPIKSLPTLKSLNPGYTRFGFKLNYDVNPFSITKNISQTFSNKKNTAKKDLTRPLKEIRGLKRQATLPSLSGATSARELAKQTVMREKSFTDKRNRTRTENRTVIKGVRTNRRFDLQMRMRNME